MKKVDTIYAVILAGGNGTRMQSNLPKQFMSLGGTPIFIRSLQTLLSEPRIRQVWVGSNGDWLDLARQQVAEFCGKDPRIHLCEGGADREGTLLNTLHALCAENDVGDDDVVLIHDAVRPFATRRIIRDVIAELSHCDVCNTVVPVNDTIVQSADGSSITGMPRRSELFAGQSPQGFRIRALLHAFDMLLERGHTIVIIEHNIDVIKCADHVIDLGPEGGDAGGNLVVCGTPEQVAACPTSHTARFLRPKLSFE